MSGSVIPDGEAAASALPCLIINLKRHTERLAMVSVALGRMGVPHLRHPGIDGRRHATLIERRLKQPFYSPAKGRKLTGGEIGCTLSHLGALRRVVREGWAGAVILEDDAVFEPAFEAFYRNDLPALLQRFDVIKMEGIFFDHVSRDGALLSQTPNARVVLPLKPSLGTAAYAVNQKGARRLLRALTRIDDPFDVRLAQYERHRARFAELRPMLVRQADIPSTLEGARARVEGDEKENRAAALVAYAQRVGGRLAMWGLWLTQNRLAGPVRLPAAAK